MAEVFIERMGIWIRQDTSVEIETDDYFRNVRIIEIYNARRDSTLVGHWILIVDNGNVVEAYDNWHLLDVRIIVATVEIRRVGNVLFDNDGAKANDNNREMNWN